MSERKSLWKLFSSWQQIITIKSIKTSCNDNYWPNPPTYRITLDRNCAHGQKKLVIYCKRFVKVHQEWRAQRKMWKEISTIFCLNCTSCIKLKFCNFKCCAVEAILSCYSQWIAQSESLKVLFSGIFKISPVKKILSVSSTTKQNCLLFLEHASILWEYLGKICVAFEFTNSLL